MKKFLLAGMLIFSLTGCASISPLFQSKTPSNTEETQEKKETAANTEIPANKETPQSTRNQSPKQEMPQAVKKQETQKAKSNPAIKNYAGVTKDELAKAIENVLYLIDPTDAKIVRQDDTVISYRYYSDKLKDNYIFGYDTWVVTISEQKDKSIDVSLLLGIAQDFSTAANSSVQPKTPAELYFNANALDEAESVLFFERLDYFLGKSPTWRSCENIQAWVKENNYKGMFHDTTVSNSLDLPFICGHNWYGIEDRDPSFLDKKK